MSPAYNIRYTAVAEDDIGGLRAFDERKVLQGIEEHLARQPQRVSQSRIKAMEQPFWSQYRLRIDEFRVYYDVDEEGHAVNVLRVVRKGTGPTPQKP